MASSSSQSQPVENKAEKDFSYYLPLYKAALQGDWERASRFFEQDPDAVTARIMPTETTLHVAAWTGTAHCFVKELVEKMSPEEVALTTIRGITGLSMAANVGDIDTAKLLVNKNPDLPNICDQEGELPLHRAAQSGHKEMLLYLLQVTREDLEPSPFAHGSGVMLLRYVILAEFYDVAIDLVQRYPKLATLNSYGLFSPLNTIAVMSSAFLSQSELKFWQRHICSCIPLKLENFDNHPNGGDAENPADSSQVHMQMCSWFRFLKGNHFVFARRKLHQVFWEVIGRLVPHIKHVHRMKLMHHQAIQLVKLLCTEASGLDSLKAASIFKMPIILGATHGIPEVVEEIAESFPNALLYVDTEDRNIIQRAVIYRHQNVFNLIYQMSYGFKHYLVHNLDKFGNNILHLAGNLAPPDQLNRVSGAALQMQRELQWFKEVERLVQPAYKLARNHERKTPRMVFTEAHKDLVKEGEQWMKDTANSCTVVAALIATVVFAAAITVPGGNNGDSGFPIFFNKEVFIFFAVADALSLFTSTASILMFLSILTARYAEDDFLYALPKRLIIGLLTLFLSITSMMIAFSATLYLVFGESKSWILISVAASACLLVTLFMYLQFPLVVDMIYSTYGPGIFGKQRNRLL